MKKMVSCICPVCGSQFERSESYMRDHAKYGTMSCSRSCSSRFKKGKIGLAPHGTVTRYMSTERCRCEPCRSAAVEYQKKRRAALREVKTGINELYGDPL